MERNRSAEAHILCVRLLYALCAVVAYFFKHMSTRLNMPHARFWWIHAGQILYAFHVMFIYGRSSIPSQQLNFLYNTKESIFLVKKKAVKTFFLPSFPSMRYYRKNEQPFYMLFIYSWQWKMEVHLRIWLKLKTQFSKKENSFYI